MTRIDEPAAARIEEILAAGSVRSVFQPIVDIDSGRVVAYEALARGPEGPLQRPDHLFAAARAAGWLADLDRACRTAAFRGAVEAGLLAPASLFVNVEPEILDSAPLDDLLQIAEDAPGDLQVVIEITQRALATRPAELLRTVERVRELGWGVALDDVGAEAMSPAFMPLLRPDVVKLDLRLVQDRPGPPVAEIMNAVNAYAERTGAVVLAEGIESEHHLRMARALGAVLGQGWLFGRPGPGRVAELPAGELVLPPRPVAGSGGADAELSPFAALPDGVALRRSPKSLLIELSKQLEREAMRLGPTCVVAATFQEARHFTPSTTQRYRDLVERTGFVCALGEGLPEAPLPGLRGASLTPTDPVRGEWDLVVLAPHFSAALLGRDLGDDGPDLERTFEFTLTYDRDTVVRAASRLLSRVAPRVPAPPAEGRTRRPAAPSAAVVREVPRTAGGGAGEALLHRSADRDDQRGQHRGHAPARSAAGVRQPRVRAAVRSPFGGGPRTQLPRPPGTRHRSCGGGPDPVGPGRRPRVPRDPAHPSRSRGSAVVERGAPGSGDRRRRHGGPVHRRAERRHGPGRGRASAARGA